MEYLEWKRALPEMHNQVLEQLEAVSTALQEQAISGRQIAAMARVRYRDSPASEMKTVIGPQTMVTFGEGLHFVLKETLELVDQAMRSHCMYAEGMKEVFSLLDERLLDKKREEPSTHNPVEVIRRLKRENWILNLAVSKMRVAFGAKPIKKFVREAEKSWEELHDENGVPRPARKRGKK